MKDSFNRRRTAVAAVLHGEGSQRLGKLDVQSSRVQAWSGLESSPCRIYVGDEQ